MIWVGLCKREPKGEDTHRPWEDGGRDCSDAAASPGMPCGQPPEAGSAKAQMLP